ncbi:MAG: T9SS type A sorting domain-containing protein [Bacteroidales bacterium]|nr:T9SS type A sorting domain-containing protein [Bacteroidales bacterium]
MRNIIIVFWLLFLVMTIQTQAQLVIFSEDFESDEIPLDWKEQFINGSINWRYENGGYSLDPEIPYTRKPVAAYSGQFNAMFQYQSANNEATNLITKRIGALEFAIKPELHFYHAQMAWKHGSDYYNDYLRVYYRTSATSPWQLLKTYTEATTDWVERIIVLPENDLSADYYLAFEGETHWGWGSCVDDIKIYETGILQKYLDNIIIEQASDVSVASGTENNPILKFKLKVMGNAGTCPINSLTLSSLNTSDADIKTGGVKLYLTQDADFDTENPVGSGVSFNSGKAVFTNLNYDLPTGYSYLWITYDVANEAGHRHIIDGMLESGALDINGQTYFASQQSPNGARTILQTIYSDDFESGLNWSLTGEFEYGIPQGLGGSQANPDPTAAFSGDSIIGTDLSGLGEYLGDYEKNLGFASCSAISDTFDLTFYNDMSIRYMRYLNIGVNDEANIDISADGGNTWETAWNNGSMILDNQWKLHEIDISQIASREKNVIVRYSIGTTNDYWQLSGWNIDDFQLTGRFVSKDVGVSSLVSPTQGCGNTAEETVSVYIKNYGATDSYSIIPLQYSFDGEQTVIMDTLKQVIPFGDSVLFTFKKKVDLSIPDVYNFVVKTTMNGDEDEYNDAIAISFYVQPTRSEDHTETFESKGGIWIPPSTANSNWEWGTPGYGIIPTSGSKLWATRLINTYSPNDLSFVESGCYSNSNQKRKILQLKYWISSEATKDGAAVQYSIDNGNTWELLDTLITGSNWYDGTVESIGTQGWSGVSDGWKTAKQVLPVALTNASLMKFRLVFGSDANVTDIGFAFDDFQVFEMPMDIGVTAIDDFADACQHINPDELTVTIKNFGVNPLMQDDTLFVGYSLNAVQREIDTIRLSANLAPGQTMKHTFGSIVDVSSAGNYSLAAYTLGEIDPQFYGPNNDTLTVNFEVYPGPLTSLPDTIQTHLPDTVKLTTIYNSTYDYWWNGSGGTNIYEVEDGGWQYLKVTATRGNGCSSYDSANVELLFYDLGASELVHPTDNCGFGKHEYPVVRVMNYGTDSIAAGQKIAVSYRMNSGPEVSDTLKLVNTLYSGKAVDFTFTKGALDVSQKGTYVFDLKTTYAGDTVVLNDGVTRSAEILGRPVVSLGPDLTVQALTHMLNAGSGYESYLWDDSTTLQTREINESGSYWVQVYDENLCDNSDTVNVWLKIRDISPDGFASPLSDCSFNSAEPVSLRILNSGTDTIPSGTGISVSYRFQAGTRVTGSFSLSGQLLPGAVVTHDFAEILDLSTAGDYLFEATAATTGDLKKYNDTSEVTVYRYARPVVDFGLPSSVTVEDISYEIDAGYNPNYSYLWQDGFTEHLYTATNSGLCHVIATDNRTSCYDRDSVMVFLAYPDVGVTWTDMPANGCTGEFDDVLVRVQSLGTSNIGSTTPIYVACDINGVRVTLDTLIRNTNFSPGASLELTLSGKIKITNGGSSEIRFYTVMPLDKRNENDTLVATFDALPAPVIDFGDVNGDLSVDLPHVLDAGGGHKAYLWQDASTGQTFSVVQKGVYSVTVTGQNDCQTTKAVSVNMLSAMQELSGRPEDVTIFPNPNNGLFRIRIETEKPGDLDVRIVDGLGKVVYVQQIHSEELEREQMDIQHLPRGLYHIIIRHGTELHQGKVVIQ